MHSLLLRGLPLLVGAALLAGPAGAQIPNRNQDDYAAPRDDRGQTKLVIKRATVSGTVKSLHPEKRTFILAGSKRAAEVPVDVGPSIINAGKGRATYGDIRVGDRVRVYGEVTVQGGLRAMVITLPAERMSLPSPAQVKKEKEAVEKAAAKKAAEEKAAARAAEKAAKAAEKAAGKTAPEKPEPEPAGAEKTEKEDK